MKLRDCPKQGIYFSIFLSLRGKEFQTLNSSPHLLHSSFFKPFFFSLAKKQILQFQSGSIGLFPLHTSGRNEESHVRDNVYCAMALWALGLAYR